MYQSCCAQITDVDRAEILRAHNFVRSRVSPPAANMRRMVSCCWIVVFSDAP